MSLLHVHVAEQDTGKSKASASDGKTVPIEEKNVVHFTESLSTNNDPKNAGTQFLSGNTLITEANLRQEHHSDQGLENLIAGFKHITSIDGQVALDKFINGITSKDLQRTLVNLELGHQATDEEFAKFMEDKSFVSEKVEMADGLPLYKGQKPDAMMSLGNFSMPWIDSGEDGEVRSENDGYLIASEVSRPINDDNNTDPVTTLSGNRQAKACTSPRSKDRDLGSKRSFTELPADQNNILQVLPYHMHDDSITPISTKNGRHHQPVYGPLNPDRKEIRLLSLSYEVQDDEKTLSLKLENFLLHEVPRYTSLSYAWGRPELSCKVTVNGQPMLITERLHNALVRVFSWNQRLYLWADGICINQQDIAERSAQVAMMGEIYSRATRTAAYLGEPWSNETDEEGKAEYSAFALMNVLSRIWEHDPEHALRSTDDWNTLQIPDTREVWVAMLNIWTQEWFTRAWVLQEVVLAKDICVFFGEAVSNLESLMRFWQLAQNHDIPPPLKYGSIADAEALVRNSNQLGTFKRLRDFRSGGENRNRKDGGSLNSAEFGDTEKHALNSVAIKEPLQPFNLLQLLVVSRANGATDSRDKVYSLLALANDIEEGQIIPDYNPSNNPASVYQRVAEMYLSKGLGVCVLHHAGLPQKIENLPTWVPDWSHKSHFPFTPSLYNCTPGTVLRVSLSPATSTITIRGAIIDSYSIPGLQSNFRSWDSTDYGCNDDPLLPQLPNIQSDEQLRRMIQMSAEMLMHILLEPSYHTGEDIDTALWKTLIANRGWCGGKPTDMDRCSYDAYVRSYPPSMSSEKNAEVRSKDPTLREQSWPFEKVMQDTYRGRRFGITACGHIGVFPGATRNGDLVVLLPGASMPFILRRSGCDKYKLVGDCYLHGVMEGELICDAETPLQPDCIEMNQYDLPFSIRTRQWATHTTAKTKENLEGVLDPGNSGFARFRNFCIY